MNQTLLTNSLMLAAGTTALALLWGFLTAIGLGCLPARFQKAFTVLALTILVLPPFLTTNCWLDLLGRQGALRSWLPIDLYSMAGAVWVLSLWTWPIAMLLIRGRWSRLDREHLECEPALRGRQLIGRLLLPAARPALQHAGVLIFVLALNNLAVPSILQIRVLPAELWISLNTTFNFRDAWTVGWPMLLLPLGVLILFRSGDSLHPLKNLAVPGRLLRRQIGIGWQGATWFLGGALVLLSLVVPAVHILCAPQTWSQLSQAWRAAGPATAYSLGIAAGAATSVLIAGWMSRGQRWVVASWLLFLVPGTFLALVMVHAFNRGGLLWIYQSVAVVIIALSLRYWAFGWHGAVQACRRLNPALVDAARLEGATPSQLFRRVELPLTFPSLAATWYVVYLLCLWDVEILSILQPPGTETLALRVFNLLHYGHHAQVNALCLLLLALAVVPYLLSLLANQVQRRLMGNRIARGLIAAAAAASAALVGCAPAPASIPDGHQFSRVEIIGRRGNGAGQFQKPRSIAVDHQNQMYAVDMTGRIQKFDPHGTYLLSWQMPEIERGRPKGICIDSEDLLVVVEPHYARINHFRPDGTQVAQWGRSGREQGQLGFPRAVAVNVEGDIFVSEFGESERIQRFSPRGELCLTAWGEPGLKPGSFNRPEGLGLDTKGNLYVADSCNHRIQVFTGEGQLLRSYGKAGSGPGELSYPYDICVDAQGFQYVCEFGNSRIQIFDVQDRSIEIVGGPGASPGRFNNPWSIALDSHGNLYVADAGNHRVQKLLRRTPIQNFTQRKPR